MNIAPDTLEGFSIEDANLRKSFLPDRRLECELAARSKRESTFYKPHGTFNREIRTHRDQGVEMVRHDHEFVQAEFSLAAVFVQNI